MFTVGAAARSLFVAGLVSISVSLTACGGGGGSGSAAGTIARSATASIQGSPQSVAVVGKFYSFAPQAADATASGSFTVTNLPPWAKFDKGSGQISGTPGNNDVGSYSNIVVTLVDGSVTQSLPAFTINVETSASADSVTLSWQPPTENADGSALVNLQGYDIHYGTKSQNYTETIKVANPGLTTYVVQNLPAGKYYFAVTAYNSSGVDSSPSGEVSTTIAN